jgi:hypothetical protein
MESSFLHFQLSVVTIFLNSLCYKSVYFVKEILVQPEYFWRQKDLN